MWGDNTYIEGLSEYTLVSVLWSMCITMTTWTLSAGYSILGSGTLVCSSEDGREIKAASWRHQSQPHVVHREGPQLDGSRAPPPSENFVRSRIAKLSGRQII